MRCYYCLFHIGKSREPYIYIYIYIIYIERDRVLYGRFIIQINSCHIKEYVFCVYLQIGATEHYLRKIFIGEIWRPTVCICGHIKTDPHALVAV